MTISMRESQILDSLQQKVHVFDLRNGPTPLDDDDPSWMSYITRNLVQGGLLPSTVCQVLSRGRSFATATLPSADLKSVVAWSEYYSSLLVASTDGVLRMFRIEAVQGNNWPLTRGIFLLDGEVEERFLTARSE